MIKIKKIIDITSIFLKDSYQNIDIINKKTNKLNKKSIYFWLIIILFFALFYISDKIIRFLSSAGQPLIFLNVYFLILAILLIFQTILVCTNIFYFSKELEFILPFPIKPIELLIAKFATLLCSIYITEIIFSLIPMTMYGLITNASILFYMYMLVVFIIFPIFFALIVCIVMMFVMKISRFIKNKDLFQIIMTLVLMIFVIFVEYKLIGSIMQNTNQIENLSREQVIERINDFNNKIAESNKYFLVINPCVKILSESNIKSIIEILKLIFLNGIIFILFTFIGKLTYLKDILKNTAYIVNRKKEITNFDKKCKLRNVTKSYILKEFKSIFKNPIIFIQCIFPVIIVLVTLVIMTIILVPKVNIALQNEELKNSLGDLSFDITAVCMILGLMQIIFVMSSASLTAISREGKASIFIKYIPISYYKQFLYKSIPQIFINMLAIIVVIFLVNYAVPSINIGYIFAIFILGMMINIINSHLTLLVDVLRPKLNWDTEYAIVKQNSNKMFQYAFAVIIILLLVYFNSIFEKINLNNALIIMAVIFSLIIITINIFIAKKQKELFKKIN